MKQMTHGLLSLCLLALGTSFFAVAAQDVGTDTIPSSYEVVAEDYATLETSAHSRGTAAFDQLLSEELGALYEQFNPDMAAAISPEVLEQTYAQLTGVAPIGELLSERVLVLGNMAGYAADYAWGDDALTMTVYFDANNQIAAMNLVPSSPLPDDPAQDYETETTFRLPFDDLWYTGWGGADRLHNYHVDAPQQRHAYDFVVWQGGSTFAGEGTANEDYYAYGQSVLAPTAGTVVTVVNDLPESQPQIETDAQNPAGNHVVIQTAESEYLYLAHMQPDSIIVAAGDTVEAGQVVGLVGNSGNTSEPHLHIHLQDQPEMFETDESGQIIGLTDAIGLPLAFSNYLANGERVESGTPIGGTFVQHAE